jgi:protein dithiol oxidoreductase (disulfide-forming)
LPARLFSHPLFALIFALLLPLVAYAEGELQPGQQPQKEITILNPAQPVDLDGKVEVLEFFAYGCSACYAIDAEVDAWAKRLPADVKFRRVPAGQGFEFRGIDNPPLFYTLETMGLLDRLHGKAMKAANAEAIPLGTPSGLSSWLTKEGVDAAKFEEVKKSFAVVSKSDRARRMTLTYKLSATPMFVVNGRVALLRGSTPEKLFARLDEQIALARITNRTSGAAK